MCLPISCSFAGCSILVGGRQQGTRREVDRMSKESKHGGDDSDSPPPDLKSERDKFVKSFTRGSRLTDEFIGDYERLLDRLQELESENSTLRARIEADRAVRDLVTKIEKLESEKRELLSR